MKKKVKKKTAKPKLKDVVKVKFFNKTHILHYNGYGAYEVHYKEADFVIAQSYTRPFTASSLQWVCEYSSAGFDAGEMFLKGEGKTPQMAADNAMKNMDKLVNFRR